MHCLHTPGHCDVRDGRDGVLTPPGDPLALAEQLRALALDPAGREQMARSARERAERFAWPHVAAEALDSYEQAIATAQRAQAGGGALIRGARRYGLAPRDLLHARARPEASEPPAAAPATGPERVGTAAARRCDVSASPRARSPASASPRSRVERVGLARVAASLVASKPGLLAAGLALMCAAMFARAIAGTRSSPRRPPGAAPNGATRCRARSSAC